MLFAKTMAKISIADNDVENVNKKIKMENTECLFKNSVQYAQMWNDIFEH